MLLCPNHAPAAAGTAPTQAHTLCARQAPADLPPPCTACPHPSPQRAAAPRGHHHRRQVGPLCGAVHDQGPPQQDARYQQQPRAGVGRGALRGGAGVCVWGAGRGGEWRVPGVLVCMCACAAVRVSKARAPHACRCAVHTRLPPPPPPLCLCPTNQHRSPPPTTTHRRLPPPHRSCCTCPCWRRTRCCGWRCLTTTPST
jgi:hypothetical protein